MFEKIGWSLMADEDIEEHTLICEYAGNVFLYSYISLT